MHRQNFPLVEKISPSEFISSRKITPINVLIWVISVNFNFLGNLHFPYQTGIPQFLTHGWFLNKFYKKFSILLDAFFWNNCCMIFLLVFPYLTRLKARQILLTFVRMLAYIFKTRYLITYKAIQLFSSISRDIVRDIAVCQYTRHSTPCGFSVRSYSNRFRRIIVNCSRSWMKFVLRRPELLYRFKQMCYKIVTVERIGRKVFIPFLFVILKFIIY